MLKITAGKGFKMTFKNGVTVSVQFGPGNYCENYSMGFNEPSEIASNYGELQSEDAEVAAWITDKGNEVWITKELIPNASDDVIGRLDVEDVLSFINLAKNYGSES